MQPYIMQCRIQAALQCSSPEPLIRTDPPVAADSPLRKSRSVQEKAPPPIVNPVTTNVDTSTDRESFTTDAKSSPDRDTEYGDLTDGPPADEGVDHPWNYDSVGGTENSRLVTGAPILCFSYFVFSSTYQYPFHSFRLKCTLAISSCTVALCFCP